MIEWEVNVWKEFMRTTKGVILAESTPNKVIWAPSSSERFSCRSFRRLLALDS